jgi:hydroxyacylglutathione hydrolase
VSAIRATYPDVHCAKYPSELDDPGARATWEPLHDGQDLAIGDITLTVVHTPGHAPDHCVFWHDPSRTMFTGDLIIPGGSVVIDTRRGGDMRQYLTSLAKVLEMNPNRLLPAHGDPIDRPADAISAGLRHRLERERQVEAAVGAGYDSIAAITEFIYHGLPPALMPAARENVRAHLHKLRQDRPDFSGPRE